MVLSHNLPRGSAEDRIAVRVKAKAAKALRQGHPWLFEDSIEKISREGRAGDVAVAFNQEKSVLGAGLYDPASPVRVKLLSFGVSKIPVGRELFRKLCLEAKQLRDGKLAPDTNAWRLVNGASGRFPSSPWNADSVTSVIPTRHSKSAITSRLTL